MANKPPTLPTVRPEGRSIRRTARRLLTAGLRRVRFITRFIYWTWMHGTPKHAGWVCNNEGLWW